MTGMAMLYGAPPRIGKGRDSRKWAERIEQAMKGSIDPIRPRFTPKEIGPRIREAREARGLTQCELGKIAGLKEAAVSHFETGKRLPSLINLCKLADALRVTTDKLLGAP